MKNKTAVITGGGSGIGFAITEKFIREGFNAVIIGRNREKLQEACEQLGPKCFYEQADISKLDMLPALVQRIRDKSGSLDVLVNNAGIHHKEDFLNVSDEDYQRVVLINQTSVFAFSREVAKIMSHNKEGSIVHISSMASFYGIPKIIAYTAAKAAIEGMTRAMAVELTSLGIRVNCVAPGFISTEMSKKALENDPDRKSRVMARTPAGKLGSPKDVANAVYFLCSPEASYISGVVLPVDGGNSIGF